MQTAKPKPAMNAGSEISKRIEGAMTLDQQMEQARNLIKSGLLPQHIDTPEKFIVIAQTGKELGLPQMVSLRSIYVVHGNTGLTAQLMRALCERSGQLETFDVTEATESKCVIKVKRKGKSARTYIFTREEADKAKFSMTWNKDAKTWKTKDAWEKQPATMLEWRCTSKALRREFSDVITGLYTPEEIAHDVELVEAQAAGAEGGEKVTSIELKPAIEAKPVEEPTRHMQEENKVPAVSDVTTKPEDLDDEAVMRWPLPGGIFKGQSLMTVYYQESGSGVKKGKKYLEDLVKDPKTGKNSKTIVERFLAIIAKEERK